MARKGRISPRPRTMKAQRCRSLSRLMGTASSLLLAHALPALGDVVADGRTQTNITRAGGVTDVHTGTVSAGHGVNTFSSFSTAAGSTTNIHVPAGAQGTVNIVNGAQSVIQGAVNSVSGGAVGGDLYFANSRGVVVGPDGSIQAGSVSISTPTQAFVQGVVGPNGQVSASHVDQLLRGEAPQQGDADVSIAGQVQGQRSVRIRAGRDIAISGAVQAGSRAAVMGAAVNTGRVTLDAGRNITVAPGGRVTGAAGADGGHLHLRAVGDISVQNGATMLAEGAGAGHGGTIDVFAQNAAYLDLGGRVSVAALGDGDGGFVEYSAQQRVEIYGLLEAYSVGGSGGLIYIDPEDEVILSTTQTRGAALEVEALNRIIVLADAVLSTRNTENDESLRAESVGNSGALTLIAPNIEVQQGAQLLAFATGDFEDGDITLSARRIDPDGHGTAVLLASSTSISIDRAYIHGGTVTILAETLKDNRVDAEGAINDYVAGLNLGPAPQAMTDKLVELGEMAASKTQAVLDAANYENWPSYLNATAEIGIDRSVILGTGSVSIDSIATANVQITPQTGGMALVIAASVTNARTIITDSRIAALDRATINSTTNVRHNLRAEGVAGGEGSNGLNIALAASLRMGEALTVVAGRGSNALFPTGVTTFATEVIEAGQAIAIGAENITDVIVRADSVLGPNGRGAALTLSLDDRAATTAVSGQMATLSGDVDFSARNHYARAHIDARVTGGDMEAEDAPDAPTPAGDADQTEGALTPVLGAIAAQAQEKSGVGAAAGITTQDENGTQELGNAFALGVALSNHNARADVSAIVAPATYVHPVAAAQARNIGRNELRVILIPETRNFFGFGALGSDAVKFVPGPLDLSLVGMRVTAENVLANVRQSALTAAGAAPDAGEAAGGGPAAAKTALFAISLADWDLDATVRFGDETGAHWTSVELPGAISIAARNVAVDYEDRDALDTAHALYSGARQADAPREDGDADALAALADAADAATGADDTDAEAAEAPAEDTTPEDDGGAETGEGDVNGDDEDAPYPGGLIGSWSDGQSVLFGREGGGTLALSSAQTFAAGEELGAGLSVARLTGDHNATAILGAGFLGSALGPNETDLDSDDPRRSGNVSIIAEQVGAWGASAGQPGMGTGANDGGSYGASVAWVNIGSATRAIIEDRSYTDNTGDLELRATDDRLVWSDARAHGVASGNSFSGALSVVQRRDLTEALVAYGAGLFVDGTLKIHAMNSGDTVTVVSAAAMGRRAVGIGIALTFADRITRAAMLAEGDYPSTASWFGQEANLGGLDILASSQGNVITGGRTSAGIEEEEAPETPASDPDADPENSTGADDDAPTVIDHTQLGDDGGRVADAVGGANPLTGGGGEDDSFAFAFAGDFGAIFSDVVTEATISGHEKVFWPYDSGINLDVDADFAIRSETRINYGQSSAVTAVATGGIGISGSFGLTAIEHLTATRIIDSTIHYRSAEPVEERLDDDEKMDEPEKIELKPLIITSVDESRFDLLVDGRSGRPDGGWGVAIAASFARLESTTRTELRGSTDLKGSSILIDQALSEGDSGCFDVDDCGNFGEPQVDGRQFRIWSVSDPTLTIRATSLRTGPDAEVPTPDADPNADPAGDDATPATDADAADATQMDAVGDLVRDAGSAANAQTNGGSDGGLKGISITIAPLRQISDAEVLIENTRIDAQVPQFDGDTLRVGNPGVIDVRSRARTNLDIDASSDAIAAAIAITDTSSQVTIRSSELNAPGNGQVYIVSEAEERHKMRATAGAARTIKAAGVLSLRSLENRVLVDADETRLLDDRTTEASTFFRSGGVTEIAARSTHDLDFEVIAGDGSTAALALAGIISLAESVTETAVAATILADGSTPVLIEATNTYTRYSARAIAAAGSLVPGSDLSSAPPEGGGNEDAPGSDGGEPGEETTTDESPQTQRQRRREGQVATALLDVADETEESVKDDAPEGDTEAQPVAESAARKASFAIAFVLDRHDDTTSARVAALRLLPEGETPITLGGFEIGANVGSGAPGFTLNAVTKFDDIRKVTRAGIGLGDAAPDRGAVFAVALGDWRITTDAMIGDGDLLVAGKDVTVSATTEFPDPEISFDREKWFEGGDDLFKDGGGGFAEGGNLPKSADSFVGEGKWNIITSTQTDFGKLGMAVDVALHRFRADTRARILNPVFPAASGKVTVAAETKGAITSRRDSAGLVPVVSGGSGAGGSGHVLLLRPTTEAIVNATPTGPGIIPEVGELMITARNAMSGAVASASFGKSEGFALNIAFSMIDYVGLARARLRNPSQLEIGQTTVRAEDNAILLADAGSKAAGNTSIGVSVALIFGDRTAEAEILAPTSLTIGATTVQATVAGTAVGTSQAGAGNDDEDEADPAPETPGQSGPTDPPQPEEGEPETRARTAAPTKLMGDRTETNADDLADMEADDQGNETPVEGASFGFALAGDFTGLFGQQNVYAGIRAGNLDLLGVNVEALNDVALFGGAGSTITGAGKVGIAASAAINGTRRFTRAELLAGAVRLGDGNAVVAAHDTGAVKLMAAGRAGAAVNISVAGSAAVDLGRVDTDASMFVSFFGANDDQSELNVEALNATTSLLLAGAVRPEGDEEEDGGVGIGLAFAGYFAAETTAARLQGETDVALSPINASVVRVRAVRAGSIDGVAASSGAADKFSLAGAAVVTLINRELLAEVVDVDIRADSLVVEVIDTSPARLRVGSDSAAGKVSIGLAGAVLVETRSVLAKLRQSVVGGREAQSDAPDVIVRARQEGDVDLLQIGAGEAGDGEDGFSASLGLGLIESTRTTRAEVLTNTISADDLTVSAVQKGNLRNRQGVTNKAGFAGSVGVIPTRLTTDVAALISGTSVDGTGDAAVTASESTALLSRSAKSGSGKVGIDLMVATAILRGEVLAEVTSSTVQAHSLEVAAEDKARVQSAAIARSDTSTFGAVGGVAYAANRMNVTARLTGPMTGFAGGVTVRAMAETGYSGTVVGLNMGGEGVSASLQVGWLTANRDVQALVQTGNTNLAGDLTITAEREEKLLAVGVTAAESDVSVGIAGNVLQTGGETRARLVAGNANSVAGTLAVHAEDRSQAINIAIGAAAGDGVSIVGSLSYVQMGRRPASAVLTEENERSAEYEATNEAERDGLADRFADGADLDAQDLKRRFDLTTEAQVFVQNGGSLTTGATAITVADDRRATALAGQIQVKFSSGGLASDALDIAEINENGMSVNVRDTADGAPQQLMALYLGGGSASGSDDAGIGEAGAQAAGASPGSDAGGGGGGSGGIAIGASMGWVRLGGLVSAELRLGSSTTSSLGDLIVSAGNTARAAGVSVGAQAGGDVSIGAGAGISRHDQFVRSRILGSSQTTSVLQADSIAVTGTSDGRSRGIGGLVVATDGNVAAGATLAVSQLDAQTEAVIDFAKVSSAGNVTLGSTDTSRSLALAITGGVSSGFAVSVSIGVNLAQSVTRALLRDTTLTAGGSLVLASDRAQAMNSFVLQVAAGGTAGIGAALAVSQQRGSGRAEILSSEVDTGGNVVVGTEGASSLFTAAVGAAAGGSVAVSGSVSLTLKEEEAAARIAGSTILSGDTVLVQAVNGGSMGGAGGGDDSALDGIDDAGGIVDASGDSATGTLALGGALGIGVSVAVLTTRSDITAEIVDSDVQTRPTGTASGVSGLGRQSGNPMVREATLRRGVHVVADNQTKVRGVAITAGGGGTVGIGAQVPVLILRDNVSARIADSDVGSADDVMVFAGNATDIRTVSAVAGVGGAVGVGALIDVGSLKKTTIAEIDDAVIVAGNDVDVQALTPEKVTKFSLGAGGGGTLGIAGVVESLVTKNATYAGIRNAEITAGQDVRVRAVSPRSLEHNAGTLSIAGVASIAGTVLVIKAEDEVIADIGGTGLTPRDEDDDKRNDGDFGPLVPLLPDPPPVRIDAGGIVSVTASARLSSTARGASLSAGGVVGAAGSIVVTAFEQRVLARVAQGVKIGEDADLRPSRIEIVANQQFDQDLLLGTVAGGGVAGLGATVGITNVRNTVFAGVGDDTVLRARDLIEIRAQGVRDLNATAITGVAGGLVGFAGTALVASFAASADDRLEGSDDEERSRRQGRGASSTMKEDPFEIRGRDEYGPTGTANIADEDAQTGGLLAEAAADRQSINLDDIYADAQVDAIRAVVGAGAVLQSGGSIRITAREGGDINMAAGSLALGGAVGLSGGVVTLKRGSNVATLIGDGAQLSAATDVQLLADVDSNDGNQNAYAGAGGLLGGAAAAVSTARIARTVAVRLDGTVSIFAGGLVSVRSNEVGVARASNFAAAAGAVGIGGTFTTTVRDSLVRTVLNEAQVFGADIAISARRQGNVETDGIAAAGGAAAAITGVLSIARDRSRATVDLGSALLSASFDGALTVEAVNAGRVEALAKSATIAGGAAAALGWAIAERTAVAQVLGNGTALYGGTVAITSSDANGLTDDDASIVSTFSQSSARSGGASGAGAYSDTLYDGRSEILLSVQVIEANNGNLLIVARSNSAGMSESTGVAVSGGAAAGLTRSKVTMDSTVGVEFSSAAGVLAAGNVDIVAQARDSSVADTQSGKGAFAVADSASAILGIRPDTRVILRGGAISALGAVTVGTDRASNFNSRVDATRLSALQGARSRLLTDVNAVILTDVETDISAPTINILANQNLRRRDPAPQFVPPTLGNSFDYTARSNGAGILGGVNGLVTEMDVRVRAELLVGGGAVLRETRTPLRQGNGIRVALTTDTNVIDLARITTGGFANFPRAEANIDINFVRADVILTDAVLRGVEDVVVVNRHDLAATAETYVRTWSVALGNPRGRAFVRADIRPRLDLRGTTSLESDRGSVRLLNGRDEAGFQVVALNAEVRVINNTPQPFTGNNLAEADVNVISTLNIEDTARVRAARDVDLLSEAGFVDAYGFYSVRDAVSVVTGALGAIISGEYNPDREGGLSRALTRSTINLQGGVDAGAFADLSVIIRPDGTVDITGASEGITVDYQQSVDRNQTLVDYLNDLLALRQSIIASGFTPGTVLQEEIDEVSQRLAALGGAGQVGDYVFVSDLFATGGNISIVTGRVGGTGSLRARGDASITVVNESAALMEIGGAEIPFRPAGEVRLNFVPVASNADLIDLARHDGIAAALDIETTRGTDPMISITGTHVAAPGGLPADLVITGDIENLSGGIGLTTLDGSILVLGADVAGKSVTIESGGDFFLTGGTGVQSLGRDPRGLYRNWFEQWENLSFQAYLGYRGETFNLDQWTVQNPGDFVRDTGTPGRLRALGNVYVSADTINIDGTIQSGETNWNLLISEGIDAAIGQYLVANQIETGRILLFSPGFDPNRDAPQLGRLPREGSGIPLILADRSVWYNVDEMTIEVDPMVTKGGRIDLIGRIVSTGGRLPGGRGELVAANGYGRVNVESASTLPLVFSAVSTGADPVSGRIRIVDTGDFVGGFSTVGGVTVPFMPRETVYRMSGDQITRTRTELFEFPTGTYNFTSLVSQHDPNSMEFEIAKNWALRFNRLRTITENTSTGATIDVVEDFDLLGRIELTTFGANTELGQNGYDYRRETTLVSSSGSQRTIRQLDTHRITAAQPVAIRFAGYDAGQIDITAVGDVRFASQVINPTGATNVTSTGGSILTSTDRSVLTLGDVNFTAAADVAGASFTTRSRAIGATNWGRTIYGGETVRESTGFMDIDQVSGATLSVDAANVLVRELSGDMVTLRVAGDTVRLEAPGSILQAPGQASVDGWWSVQGRDVDLVAQAGTIGTLASPLGVSQGMATDARLDASARGGIWIDAPEGDIRLGQIESRSADVWLRAQAGRILDGDSTETVDRRAVAGLLAALWEDLGLVATGDEERDAARIAENSADLLGAEIDAYEAYWAQRRILRPLDPVAVAKGEVDFEYADYDPGYRFKFTDEERGRLVDAGIPLDRIDAEEIERTESYHWMHLKYGDGRYDPSVIQVDPDALAKRNAEVFLSEDRLQRGLRSEFFSDATDTDPQIEVPNIIGRSITLTAHRDIGLRETPFELRAGDVLDEAMLAALWAAERTDLVPVDGGVQLRLLDDVDIDSSDSLVALAGDDLLIGSEQTITITRAVGGDIVRIVSAQGLSYDGKGLPATPGADFDRVEGREILLEAGSGSIGASGAPMVVATPYSGGFLDARAAGDIHLAGRGNLRLGEIFTPSAAAISTASGNLRAASGFDGANVRAAMISLAAPDGHIGNAAGNFGPTVAAFDGGALPLTLSAARNTSFNIAAGTVAQPVLAEPPKNGFANSFFVRGDGTLDLGQQIELAEGGDIVIATAGLALNGHALHTAAGIIDVDLPPGFTLGGGENLTTAQGNIRILGGGDLSVLGLIETLDGDLEVLVDGTLHTPTPDGRLFAPNGRLSLTAGSVTAAGGLRARAAIFDAKVESGPFALNHSGPVLRLDGLLVGGPSAQIVTEGRLVLNGTAFVDNAEGTLVLLAGQGIEGSGTLATARGLLYALDGGIGALGGALTLDVSGAGLMTVAALGGDVVLDISAGNLSADVVTAANGILVLRSNQPVRIDYVGSLEEPQIATPPGTEIGQWGADPFDMAEATGLKDGLVLTNLYSDAAAIPGPAAPDDGTPGDGDDTPGDGDDKPGDGDDTPGDGDDTPGDGDDQPGDGDDTPGDGDDKPGDGDDTPGDGDDTPGDGDDTPGDGQDESENQGGRPGTGRDNSRPANEPFAPNSERGNRPGNTPRDGFRPDDLRLPKPPRNDSGIGRELDREEEEQGEEDRDGENEEERR